MLDWLLVFVCLIVGIPCVVLIEINKKISNLHKGILPIYEPGLESIVTRNVDTGTLTFSTDAAVEIAKAEVIYIAVGTPSAEDGSASLTALLKPSLNRLRHMLLKGDSDH